MRYTTPLLSVLALCGLLASPALCQTQAEMNRTALADFEKADAALNAAYKKVLGGLENEEDKKQLIAAQRAWIAYRDAQAAFEADFIARGGTMKPLIFNETRARITEARTKELLESVAVK